MSDSADQPPRDEGQQQPPAYPPANPYGQQPPPYGQPPAYGQPPQYGAPPAYGAPPPYGAPAPYPGYQQHDPHKRPGTVTAASIVTFIFSGLVLAGSALIAVVLFAAKDEVIRQIEKDPSFDDLNVSANDVVSVLIVVLLVGVLWSVAAFVLAIFAMRRSQGARIGLVVSSGLTAAMSLVAIGSGVSAVTLIAAVAVIVLLFTGGAGAWYSGRHGDGQPGGAYSHPPGPVA